MPMNCRSLLRTIATDCLGYSAGASSWEPTRPRSKPCALRPAMRRPREILLRCWPSAGEVLFHLLESDDANAGLNGLGGDVLDPAPGLDAAEHAAAPLEELGGRPGGEPEPGFLA